MDKKSKKGGMGKGISKFLNLNLKSKIVIIIVIPVVITFLSILISISVLAPRVVNKIKEENIRLELQLIQSYLKSLSSEAVHGCDYFSDKEDLSQALVANDVAEINRVILTASKEIWLNNLQNIPDFITVTDTYGKILSQFVRYQGSDGQELYQVTKPVDKTMETVEIMYALDGYASSAFGSSSLSRLYYNTAKSIVDTRTNTVLGTVSLGYKLDNARYVDEIKGEKELDVSFFNKDIRVVTTLRDSKGNRRTDTQLDPVIWNHLARGEENYINTLKIFGQKSIAVYIPLYNGVEIAGVVGAAAPVVDISALYVILSIVCVFVAVFVITAFRILNKSILNPISNVNLAANALAEGDVSYNLNISNANDEVGQLTRSFKVMADNIKRQAELVEKISSGDLTIDVKASSDKDVLGKSLEKMIESNNLIFREIITTAEQVAVAAKQIADGSQELSIGTTQQAAAVEELTESVMKIAHKAKENEMSVNAANSQIKVIIDHVDKGTVNMNEMLTAVEEIEGSSTNISKIIRVIDDIAFQTNILSLNAAVEAARAGEHGRGFAVVAEEVRNLAAKSAKAAKETSEMIEESIIKAKQGKDIAVKTSDTFNEIAEGVSKIEKLIGEIDNASKEQVQSTNAATNGADSVSKVVQTNAATAEESAAASEEMSSQASALTDLVKNQFKLKSTTESKINKMPVIENGFGKY